MNTFQKYYEQQELQQFIEDVLETTATPVGLGVFYVFRDPADQQDFLSARSRRAIDWNQISARLGLGAPAADRWEGLYAEHQELLDAFGNTALSLGRWPTDDEFVRAGELIYKLGSLKRALRAFVQGGGAKDLSWGEVGICWSTWGWPTCGRRCRLGTYLITGKGTREVVSRQDTHRKLGVSFRLIPVGSEEAGRIGRNEVFGRHLDPA